MEIREGYKQTGVGVIPEDWEVTTLEDLSMPQGLVRGPFGGSLKKEYFVQAGYKVYEQRNAIYKEIRVGNYYIDKKKYDELIRFSVKHGDFIVSCSGTIGKIYQIPRRYEQGVINQALLKITLDYNKIVDKYFEIYFNWDKFQNKIIDNTQGGAMKNLVGMDVFKKTLMPRPPYPEQQAIATALSDMDGLINSLQKLIGKKKNIKQGAMQELLTGKRRLEGFSGEWVEVLLKDVVKFFKGKGFAKSDISNGGKYKCIHYGELFTVYKEKIKSVISRTNNNEGPFLSKENDVLMPTSDVTPNGLAKASCIQENNVILGGDILIIRSGDNIDGVFLSNVIRYNESQVLKLVSGITVYHLYASDMKNFYFYCPPTKAEQAAIANILSDMDSEIEALERKLDKYRDIKQGMMQELLTGRIRLLEEVVQ